MAIAPNDADSHIAKAKILNATGRAAEAEAAARYAMRLDPQYAPDYLRTLALALFNQGRYDDAVATMQRVVNGQSAVAEDYATLAASYGQLGQTDKTATLIVKYNSLAVPTGFDPLTVQELGWWWYGDLYSYHEPYVLQLQDGLRKAGAPEGAGTDVARADYRRLMSRHEGEYDVTGVTKLDVAEAHMLVERGDVAFVDVRAGPEYDKGHIPGAHSLSLATALSPTALGELVARDRPVAFYCYGKHCPYSAYASAKARLWGYEHVYYFMGGFPAWADAGYPEETATVKE